MLSHLASVLIGAFSFIFVLGVLVFIHEMGHYSIARLFGVAVERFSVGFGQPLWKRKAKSGTEWVIARIPLGGYVKFLGDAGAASNPDTEALEKIRAGLDAQYGQDAWKSCLHFKPLYQRALVAFAGPAANFIFAAFLFAVLALSFGTNSLAAKITNVRPGTAAAAAGLLPGDRIVAINNKKITEARQVAQIIAMRSGDNLQMKIERDGKLITLIATPKRVEARDGIGGKVKMGKLGVELGGEFTHKKYGLGQAAVFGVANVKDSLAGTFHYIGRIFRGKEDGKALGGIVKIAAITGKVGAKAATVEGGLSVRIKSYISQILWLAATLSVGLGFANLMPIPVLDGGHLLYYLYEAVMRRPLNARAQEIGFRVGAAVLLTLFVILTFNDFRYLPGLFEKAG